MNYSSPLEFIHNSVPSKEHIAIDLEVLFSDVNDALETAQNDLQELETTVGRRLFGNGFGKEPGSPWRRYQNQNPLI